MEDEFFKEQITYSKKRKFLFELKDLLRGVAFPIMISLIFSSTIIGFASTEDLTISLLALIGGEAMFIAALIIFGRANGSAAYKSTLLHAQKRDLGSKEEQVVYYTGEYALWKAAIIGAIVCVPFIIFQVIQLCAPNTVTSFCLRYMCAWAYYPFSYLGERYEALNFILVALPIGVHMLGYYLGKLKVIAQNKKEQQAYENKKRRGRK